MWESNLVRGEVREKLTRTMVVGEQVSERRAK